VAVFDRNGYLLLYRRVDCHMEGCWDGGFGLSAVIDFWDLGHHDAPKVQEDLTRRSYIQFKRTLG
jgi:hypothetical protein